MAPPNKVMTFGEILDTTIKLCTNNFLKFCLIGGTWVVGFVLLFALIIVTAISAGIQIGAVPQTIDLSVMPGYFVVLFVVVILAIFVMQLLAIAALTKAVGQSASGELFSFGDCYRVARHRFWALFGTIFLAGIFISLGFLLLIVPGILLALAYCILSPIIILENRSGIDALKRSWFLMKGNKGKAFVLMILIIVAQQVVGLLAALLPIPFLNFFLQMAVMVAAFVFGQAAVTILYFHAAAQKS